MSSIEGIIVNIDGQRRGRIEIDQETGLITKISEPTGVADVVLEDELIFPGFVDLHVHARECVDHTQDYKEDFKTASEAAIAGGVVAFAEMPNNPTPPIDGQSYKAKEQLTKRSEVEIVLYAGIGENTKPLATAAPYKVFMGPSVGTLFFYSLEDLEKTLVQYRGSCVSFHCEDPKILEENKNELTHDKRRPKEAEIKAIDFALTMIEKYNLQGKICHCSTKEGIEKIKNAKMHKLNVVAEVSPHHLFYDTKNLTEENKNWMQMNPPLRTTDDRAYLIEALREGTIDFLATDHAPHTGEEKLKGTSGTPQLDTYGYFTTWLMKEHNFTPEAIAKVCSYNPGKFFNQFTKNRYGKVEGGYAGSLTIIDLRKSTTIKKEMLKTKCGWSPFEGVTFPGSVVMTIIKGKRFPI
ncbi:amidohydrolase [Candidatus Nomurabacteria bacterium RIFCSPLOWO2_01_FULL_39_18]|uniref:Amidohydrolase n=1 Tax=Candidatus Nomurabacteria bacterium RIFCSPHIGHO2_01_FULL_40_24b TaxID=1801739 RepID=A0A1F6V6R7_9BACT|nr:MAG: amidohydrolase [Candidatus Nomurabacteria bacterium RIFCSPHIGHO2_01_FULL_40_24b]OGI89120.1 MAG: amidohydrolase [Candidatus Nomurabacteria bacterium RIFCSPLOWO2_01_FULL_39_18]